MQSTLPKRAKAIPQAMRYLKFHFLLSLLVTHCRYLTACEDIFAHAPCYESVVDRTECVSPCAVPNEFALLPASEVLPLITQTPLMLQNVLIHDMYKATYPLYTRALATYPTLSPLLQDKPEHCWDVTIKPFFIFTPKMRFGPKSAQVDSYLNLISQDDIIAALDDEIFTGLDVPEVLPLLKNITIEQRQLGAMLFLQGKHTRWFYSLALPVYYLENNYQLPADDLNKFENAAIFTGDSAFPIFTPSLDSANFIRDHLVSDKLGIGDTRVETWYEVGSTPRGNLDVGLQMTIPTAAIISRGIYGAMPGQLCKTKPIPYFDLQTIVSLYAEWQQSGSPSAAADLTQYLLCLSTESLDKFSAIVLDAPLGEQHATVGAVVTGIHSLGHPQLFCQVSGEFTYYIPGHEIRFFKTIVDPTALIQRNYEDVNQFQANLNSLSQRATDLFFPTATCALIHPGFMTNITAALRFEHASYTATAGFNIWGRTREQLSSINKRYPVIDPLSTMFAPPRYAVFNNLQYQQGLRGGAYTGKIFGAITSTIYSHHSYDTHIGLRGDATVFTSNIGYDFTLGADFIVDF